MKYREHFKNKRKLKDRMDEIILNNTNNKIVQVII